MYQNIIDNVINIIKMSFMDLKISKLRENMFCNIKILMIAFLCQ